MTSLSATGSTPCSEWIDWPDSCALTSAPFSNSVHPPAPYSVDEKCVGSCYRWLDRVVCLCQHPHLNLKVSSPYLLDIIPDIYEKLRAIVFAHQNDFDLLNGIHYFCVFIHTVTEHCRRAVRLFNRAKETIFDLHSPSRMQLTKLTLVFSHLLSDLTVIFPGDRYTSNFRITKPDAAKWWVDNFGTENIVAWSEFELAFSSQFGVLSDDHLQALRNTIDLTRNAHVSIFEFDIFTRLFQPWANIFETWKALTISHPGYMAFMTYDQVRSVLSQFRIHPGPGSYVFRLSCTNLGQWAIGYVNSAGQVLQTIIRNKSLVQALLDGERDGFYLYPNGQTNPSALMLQLLHHTPQRRVQVTYEQYQTYCEMGSAFELCKICDENNKNIELEPCGHLLCRPCLISCQTTGHNQTCPFCRFEIKGVEEIVIESYKPQPPARMKKPQEFLEVVPHPIQRPPPVPPRCPPSSAELLAPEAQESAESSLGSFCYPNLMCSDKVTLEGDPYNFSNDPLNDTFVSPRTRLNYAQLELTPSEAETEVVGENHSVSVKDEQVSRTDFKRCLSAPASTLMSTATVTDMLVEHLIHVHPDMSRSNAELLLSITNNQLGMIGEIWRHFSPRKKS